MRPLRFAVFGAGFWSRFQLAGWRELEGVECVAVYNRTRSRGEALAARFGIPAVYDNPEALIAREKPDFIDVITEVDGHGPLVLLAAAHKIPVICQKPMAPTLEMAERMVKACRDAAVPFLVHENFRWQAPMRQLKKELDEGRIGRPFRAHIQFCTSFPVFKNQPLLKELERLILADLGSHLLDLARFFFGEVESLCCRTQRIHTDIRGEDVATVLVSTQSGVTVLCEMSFATRSEREMFPHTFVFVEGESGSVDLGRDCWIRTTTAQGTRAERHAPPQYPWVDPAYEVAHASIVPCNANLLQALRGTGAGETTGEDNLKTMRLVFASYESARSGRTVGPAGL